MPLRTDAYTVGSPLYQSQECHDLSVYYATHRKSLSSWDHRIAIVGLDLIIEELFYDPLTHEEIDECVASLASYQVTNSGFIPYPFPEAQWREVVDKYNGRPPIIIDAVRMGSVVYPNEPFVQVQSAIKGFGELAAWVESKILQIYGMCERVTRNQQFLEQTKIRIRQVDPIMSDEEVSFIASTMLIDFSDRAGLNQKESEDLGLVQFLTFSGSDNLSGHYQAYKYNHNVGVGCSILALAHRNVEAFNSEFECFEALNAVVVDGGSASFVADCNDYKVAIEKMLIPIIKENIAAGNGKIVVARPDSGDVNEQIAWTLGKFKEHGLTKEVIINGNRYHTLIGCKLILADGLSMNDMLGIIDDVILQGFVFWESILFGSGGGLRNFLKRDNPSTKFALNAKGLLVQGVCKFSEDSGKGTLPGPLKLIRTPESILNGTTVVHSSEYPEIEDELINFYNGSNLYKPFGEGMDVDFQTVRTRLIDQYKSMPKTMFNDKYRNYPISEKLGKMRDDLMSRHAPGKVK